MPFVCVDKTNVVSKVEHLDHAADLFMVGDDIGDAALFFKFSQNQRAHDGTGSQHGQHLRFQFFDGNGLAVRQRMVRVHQHADLRSGYGQDLQRISIDGCGNSIVGEIDNACLQMINMVLAGAFIDKDPGVGPCREQLIIQHGEKLCSQGGRDSQTKCVSGFFGHIGKSLLCFPAVRKDTGNMDHELLTFRGEGHILGCPCQKTDLVCELPVIFPPKEKRTKIKS